MYHTHYCGVFVVRKCVSTKSSPLTRSYFNPHAHPDTDTHMACYITHVYVYISYSRARPYPGNGFRPTALFALPPSVNPLQYFATHLLRSSSSSSSLPPVLGCKRDHVIGQVNEWAKERRDDVHRAIRPEDGLSTGWQRRRQRDAGGGSGAAASAAECARLSFYHKHV